EGARDRCGGLRDGLAARVAEDFAARRRATWSLFPGAIPGFEHLRARGIALGLVTNGDAGMQREKIERWDLARFFDVVVIEGEFGCGKPDARVYRHALDVLGANPRDAWMVGDHLVWDVLGAKQVGVSAAWLDRPRQGLPSDAPVVPDRILGSLADLTTLEGPRASPSTNSWPCPDAATVFDPDVIAIAAWPGSATPTDLGTRNGWDRITPPG